MASVTTGSVYFAHADHLGTLQMLMDETGAVVWDATYRPFGEAAGPRGAAGAVSKIRRRDPVGIPPRDIRWTQYLIRSRLRVK